MAKTSTPTKGKTVKAKHITKVKPAQSPVSTTSSRPAKGPGCRPTDEV